MSYVSSAGLRVLLIMYKSLQDKSRFKMLFMTRHAKCVFRLAADTARSGGEGGLSHGFGLGKGTVAEGLSADWVRLRESALQEET